jgi:hypothetical protein
MSARSANRARNARATPERRERWAPARDALWRVLDGVVAPGARVGVVGAGNGDDLPLGRLLERAARVDLIDIDHRAPARALAHEPRRERGHVVRADVTGGAADAILRGRPALAPSEPLGDYDVLVADLFYTQLLYPALLDRRLGAGAIDAALLEHGQRLTGSVVARLHASAPVVVHVHDALGWWEDHDPRGSLDELLSLPPLDAIARSRACDGPYGCDVAAAVEALRLDTLGAATWRWPFTGGVDYFVYALVAGRRSIE